MSEQSHPFLHPLSPEFTSHFIEVNESLRTKRFSKMYERSLGSLTSEVESQVEAATNVALKRRIDQHHLNAMLVGQDYDSFGEFSSQIEFLPESLSMSMLSLLEVSYDHAIEAYDETHVLKQGLAELGKGLAFDLGHIDQFGDWAAAQNLDASAARFKDREAIFNSGFVVDQEYRSDDPLTSYEFKDISDKDSPSGLKVIRGVRKRPLLDLRAIVDGVRQPYSVKLFRRSEFLILPYFVETGNFTDDKQLGRYLTIAASLDANKDEEAMQLSGMGDINRRAGRIIDLAIQPAQRENQVAVFPLGSIYIAPIHADAIAA